MTKENFTNLTGGDIFAKIWFSPRKVFRFINDFEYDKHVYVLLFLTGIASTFNTAISKNWGDKMPLFVIIIICVIFGGLFGWISYYIYAALISWTGKWLDGKGNTESLLRIISFLMIPSIFILIFLISKIIIFENDLFQSGFDIRDYGIIASVVFCFFEFFQIILGIWSLIILIIGISEVQKLSIGKTILNLILPVLIVVVPISIILILMI